MNTNSDKQYLNNIKTQHPEIYQFIIDKDKDISYDLHIGCHDILNIITLISGNLQLMSLRYPMLERDPRWLQLNQDTDYLIQCMNQISAYRYSGVIHPVELSIEDYISSLKELICDDAHLNTLNLHWNVSDELYHVTMDPDKITFVITALLKNISDIENNAEATIDWSCTDTNVIIRVSDTLPDFDLAVKEKLFRPFNSSRTDHIGLELATSYEILLAHDGLLTYSPNSPVGSVFTLSLPVD